DFIEKLEVIKICDEFKKSVGQRLHYNYACGFLLSDKKELALKEFAVSIELGFWDWEHIEKDIDFDPICDEDDFKKAITHGKALEVLGVAIGERDAFADFMKEKKIKHAVMRVAPAGGNDPVLKPAIKFAGGQIAFVDRGGNLRAVIVKFSSYESLEAAVKVL